MRVTVIDSACGTGKTTYLINMMRNSPETRFIYITPFLSEVNRICEAVPEIMFYEPKQYGKGKLDSFNKLLEKGKSVVSTHALFSLATQETVDMIEAGGYTLILDEVLDVIDSINMKKDDVDLLFNKGVLYADENGSVRYNEDEHYDGDLYKEIVYLAKRNRLIMINGYALIWLFPADVFNSFKDVYVATYMFNCQTMRYYYDSFGVEYDFCSVKNGDIVDYYDNHGTNYKNLINIYDGKLNSVGKKKNSLSAMALMRDSDNTSLFKMYKNSIVNYFINITKSSTKDNMWTCKKAFKTRLSGKGYTKGFLQSSTRATNDYADRHNCVYFMNKYMKPMIQQFFHSKGVTVDMDMWATSELIQWLFRSAIRNNEPINIYIPSVRMRGLLKKWIAGYKEEVYAEMVSEEKQREAERV